MDFVEIEQRYTKGGQLEVYPVFVVGHSKDLMVRGKQFYAIWDEEAGQWSTDEYDVQRLVDVEIKKVVDELREQHMNAIGRYLRNFSNKGWLDFKNFVTKLGDNSHQLDTTIEFANSKPSKKHYSSRRLEYELQNGPCPAYEKLISTLYDPDERAKIEWAIGSIISGDSKKIQKFLVFYGAAGAGKSTILNIMQDLFDGYYISFDARSLASNSDAFSTGQFHSNPLVAIQHDGDLSHIEDNSKLNSIISHEDIIVNEKFKSPYTMRMNAFLIMATNRPVKITDAKSGILRRLIDVQPSGRTLPPKEYMSTMAQIKFELGQIAQHCLDIYREMGPDYYMKYKPTEMMYKTNPFFNFVEDNYLMFLDQDPITLKQAYAVYKEYEASQGNDKVMKQYLFREELKNYYNEFLPEMNTKDGHLHSVFKGFKVDKFESKPVEKEEHAVALKFDCDISLLDEMLKDCPAQYGSAAETPTSKWDDVKTTLKDLDTHKLHYVRVPENHIVIDFDIKDSDGKKSFEKNLEAADKWPKTYAELSKSGSGIHLHYIYNGDVTKLSCIYDENIEVKVFTGKTSLRRKLTKCNDIPVATISSGLPLKGEKVVNKDVVKSEKGLRTLIKRNLAKDIHPGTKPSIDFIDKILSDAYNSGMKYDVSDLKQSVLLFAINSTNHSDYCLKMVNQMKFKSDDPSENKDADGPIIFYDVEVFPNLFLINWKAQGEGKNVVRMINPSPNDVEELMQHKLVGFNCRRYDNHMLYARMMGYTNEQLFHLSQRIINEQTGFFGEAYNISYADIYDFSSKKQSLKKFEIDLGIHHQELGLPWDQPVPEEMWEKVAEYCDNDVLATEATWNDRQEDFMAREILADISGLTVNDTTRMHATKIIFGSEKHPDLVYTDLREMFPGYTFENGKSQYRGEDPGEGGYVYAEPGMYENVALLDIASMHPSSIRALNLFGSYTKNFTDILDARIAIKHHDFELAKTYMNGAFGKYLTDAESADKLAQALKIVINSVYGYTTATFDNPFKDPRNIDNIVAKRGALFMINLKHEVQERGFTVAHIKTDSIKIPNATPEIIQFVMDYGKQYGYNFEHEATYEKMCLVNDAVYIAKASYGKHAGEWTATGTQFQVPYVFKYLFSKEPIVFEDMCETKQVSTELYLDMNERTPEEHDYHFVGKIGRFCPIKSGCGGGELMRKSGEKYASATGAKGYRWLESETVEALGKQEDIDTSYYMKLVNDAKDTISKYGDFEQFAS